MEIREDRGCRVYPKRIHLRRLGSFETKSLDLRYGGGNIT